MSLLFNAMTTWRLYAAGYALIGTGLFALMRHRSAQREKQYCSTNWPRPAVRYESDDLLIAATWPVAVPVMLLAGEQL